jgi:serine/threonine-protein kinase
MHRDIKPSNIIFSDGIPKLTDFGIARPVTVSIHTKQGDIPGTVAYMAPEACTGGECNFHSDIYQIGLLMYECISGNPAYPQTAIASVVDAIKSGTRKPLRTHPKAAAIVKKCLEIDPGKRYQTAQECLADVRALYHIQNPKILPGEQIRAFLEETTPTAEKKVRTNSGRVGKFLKIAALVVFGAPLALLLVVGGFKYMTDFLHSMVQTTAEETATESKEETPPPVAANEPPPPPPSVTPPPRPKPAAATPTPTKQAPTQAVAVQDTQATAPVPEDALNLINEGKKLLAQSKPQEALAYFQKAIKTSSATLSRQDVIKQSVYGSAECNTMLFNQGKVSRTNYDVSWRSVLKAFPAGSAEYAEAEKRLDNGTAK